MAIAEGTKLSIIKFTSGDELTDVTYLDNLGAGFHLVELSEPVKGVIKGKEVENKTIRVNFENIIYYSR